MADKAGRTELLDAATQIRRMRASLEADRGKVDAEIRMYQNAEDVLKVLADADRIKGTIDADTAAAQTKLSGLKKSIEDERSNHASQVAKLSEALEVEKRKASEALASVKAEQGRLEKALSEIKAKEKDALKAHAKRRDELNSEIEASQATLAGVREQISKIANAAG